MARQRPGRQRDILNVFTDLVAEQGYDMTSLSEIASRLQVSKGTIMHHFGSKDRLLQQMALEYTERRLAELEIVLAAEEAPERQLALIVASLVTAHRDDRAATLAFSREFMRFASDPVMDEVRQLRRRYAGLISDVVSRGMDDGSFRRTDATIVALQLIGMCTWAWTWLRPDGPIAVDEVARIFVHTALDGVLTEPSAERDVLELPEEIGRLREHRALEAQVA
jgi:AcrR family transcriptional regulator